jgi:hypothetical protein
MVFMEGYGINTSRLPEQETYEAMIQISAHQMGCGDLAGYFRGRLGGEPNPGAGK